MDDVDQYRFLAQDVAASPQSDLHRDAYDAVFSGPREGSGDSKVSEPCCAIHEQQDVRRADAVSRDQDPDQHAMWVPFEEMTVLVNAWLALLGVDE